MSENQDNSIRNNSKDWRYFVITPRLVWAYARNPYDYTLWGIIKDVAGDEGECYLSTTDLAILTMMSTGQVSDSRTYWIGIGLLEGEIKKDPGYPQPVWHLAVPDVWSANIGWAGRFAKIADRVAWKVWQKGIIRDLDYTKPSPYEGLPSLYEAKPSPGETKNNSKEKPKRKNYDDGKTRDQQFGEIMVSYESNIGPITPMIAAKLGDEFDTYYGEPEGPTWLIWAMDISVSHNKRSLSYMQTCLKNRKQNGKNWKPANGNAAGGVKATSGEEAANILRS